MKLETFIAIAEIQLTFQSGKIIHLFVLLKLAIFRRSVRYVRYFAIHLNIPYMSEEMSLNVMCSYHFNIVFIHLQFYCHNISQFHNLVNTEHNLERPRKQLMAIQTRNGTVDHVCTQVTPTLHIGPRS